MICRRQFTTAESLQLHIDKSDMHEENFTKAKAEGRVTYTSDAPPTSALGASGLGNDKLAGILGAASKLEDTLKAAPHDDTSAATTHDA